ncbi:hypothetical protein L873DRAFT_1849168 [Choiromyces venosus 120613-1]|uniref:Uncharacterized protein n=1 Tax=Choiromyces venosus 120613-1 TaxID=1336337 RepID=A0A3N4IXP1_9PEZI|nr:hypothetical protein L873DRAFT_1849168 [Choiromyces venosus 120613-1]
MALQGHIEYLRGVLKRTEDERDNLYRERDNAYRERGDAYKARDHAQKERDNATAERDQLREQSKTVNGEFLKISAERAQLQEQLNALLGHGGGDGGGGGDGRGGQAMMVQQLYQRQRNERLVDAVQKDEIREHRVGRYVQYAGLAKADMLFWETMIETESRLEGLITARDRELVLRISTDMECLVERERITSSQHRADGEEEYPESIDEGLWTPTSRSTLE